MAKRVRCVRYQQNFLKMWRNVDVDTGIWPAAATIRQGCLGSRLRRLREAAGVSCVEVAPKVQVSAGKLERIEEGTASIHRRTLSGLLDQYGVTGEQDRAELMALARFSDKTGGWFQPYGDRPQYARLAEFEAAARWAFVYEPTLVPVLLQTAGYAAAVVRAGMSPGGDVERDVAVTVKRQERLAGGDPLRLWAVVDEAVLRRWVGGPQVMGEQLAALLQAAALRHITVQVLPFTVGAYPGSLGRFSVLEFPGHGRRKLVHLPLAGGELFVESPTAAAERCQQAAEHLRAIAASPADSIQLIHTMIASAKQAS